MCSQIADVHGRLIPILISAVGTFITGLISAFCQNFLQFLLIRMCLGFFIGLAVGIYALILGEISPRKDRGRRYMLMNSCFIVGEVICVVLAYYCLDTIDSGKWRVLLLETAILGKK